jgi:hypothetical protein
VEPINNKILRQLLRTLERIERCGGCPLHQHKYGTGKQTPTTQDADKPPLATIRVITELDRTQDANRNTEKAKDYDLQRKALLVQVVLCAATVAAFAAAASYAVVAQKTLNEIHSQNVAQQRAILVVDGKPIPLRGGDVGLTIRNQGRMAATVTKISMKYEQLRSNGPSLARNKEEAPRLTVTSEQPVTLSFTPPEIAPISKGEGYYIRLDIDVFYDDGFGNTQHIRPCLSYEIADDEWSPSCLSTYGIDLSKRLSTDIWLPPEQK